MTQHQDHHIVKDENGWYCHRKDGMSNFIDRVFVWIRNALTFHHLIMARFLRKHGWVVFYLDEQSRFCNGDTCWMKLYQANSK